MNIKNLKVLKKPDKKIKLQVASLIGAIALTGTIASIHGSKLPGGTLDEVLMLEGEHYLTVPIDDPSKEAMQYDYHEGYKCAGIVQGGDRMLYINDYPVTFMVNDEHTEKNSFGKPINYYKQESEEIDGTKEFNVGEHIISIPQKDIDEVELYNASSCYEALSNQGGAIVYMNTKPVKCSITKYEDGKPYYLDFGEVLEPTKTK